MQVSLRPWAAILSRAVCVASALSTAMIARSASAADAPAYFDETQGTTLFAFDEVSIPHSQNLRLEMRKPTRHPDNPVLARGKPCKHGRLTGASDRGDWAAPSLRFSELCDPRCKSHQPRR